MADLNSLKVRRAVFDCNVLLQAMSNTSGPAGACLQAARDGLIRSCISRRLLAELEDVTSRPLVMRKLHLSQTSASTFIDRFVLLSEMIHPVAFSFEHPVDPKDTMIVNLAITADADVIVSRDRHLLSLCDPASSTGVQFVSKFPGIEVLTPVELLERIKRG